VLQVRFSWSCSRLSLNPSPSLLVLDLVASIRRGVHRVCVCATRREEPEKLTEAVAMSTASADDELSLDAVIEERRLEAQNEADDARCLLLGTTSAGAIDLDGAGAQTGTGSTSPTADASTSVPVPGKRSRRRGPTSKVWLHFMY
jgi:hypothetical protein